MAWYAGPPLLEHLETVEIAADRNLDELRFPVQYVIRDHAHATTAATRAGSRSGVVRPGDEVLVLPAGHDDDGRGDRHARRRRSTRRCPPLSVTLRLADDLDISRGDLICGPRRTGRRSSASSTADVCWMADAPLRPRGRYLIKHAAHTVAVVVDELVDRVDVHTLDREGAPAELGLNDIGRVRLRTAKPVAFDPYARNRATGGVHLHRRGDERDRRGGNDRSGARTGPSLNAISTAVPGRVSRRRTSKRSQTRAMSARPNP